MKAYILFMAALLLGVLFSEAHANTPVACPMIAKLCPDGSSVSPQGPKCEVPPCPNGGDKQLQSPEPEPPEADDCDDDDCSPKPTDPNND